MLSDIWLNFRCPCFAFESLIDCKLFLDFVLVTSMKRRLPDDASSSVITKKPVLNTSVGQIALHNSV